MEKSSLAGAKSWPEVVMLLTLANARAAASGRACPVSVRVVAALIERGV
jgi:hypothetical protein